jgi:group I intron endonuclease
MNGKGTGGGGVYGIIYKVTGPGGKVYVGQTTKALKERKQKHKIRAKKGDRRTVFCIALLDEGFDNFTWEQIDQAETKEELDQKEREWIAHYNSTDLARGYNTESGVRCPLAEATKRKLSKAKKGRPSPNKGKPCSEEQKRKTSKALMGHPVSEESKRKNREKHLGKPCPWKGSSLKEYKRLKEAANE